MSTSNGVKKKGYIKNDVSLSVARRRRNSSETSEGIRSPLENFRGFNKLPRVLLTRYDITPYLNKLRNNLKDNRTSSLPLSVHALRLAQKCAVILDNHDLQKLKQELLKRRKRQISTDSVANLENDNLADILKCKICEKSYSSEKKLHKHKENKHMIVFKPNNKTGKRVSFSDKVIIHEVKEYHKCRKCPKLCLDYKQLKMHMKEFHKKRKCYICYYCNKKFRDRSFFKLHIKMHCDVCCNFFSNKAKYNEHRQYVCRKIKLHKCQTCDDIYFRFMDLKDHSYEHIHLCYVCDVCKDQFQTKCEISHHISFLHSNERPTSLYIMRNLANDRLYLCNFCDESSVERDLIELHVQSLPDLSNKVMTGYEDYYFCDHCLKKFDTETDMLQHKWSHFLKASHSQTREETLVKNNVKNMYKNEDVIPAYMKPTVVVDNLKINEKVLTDAVEFVDVSNLDLTSRYNNNGENKIAIDNPKSKKSIDNIKIIDIKTKKDIEDPGHQKSINNIGNLNVNNGKTLNALDDPKNEKNSDGIRNFDINNGTIKKGIDDLKSKMTIDNGKTKKGLKDQKSVKVIDDIRNADINNSNTKKAIDDLMGKISIDDIRNGNIKKAVVDPKSKKTIVSKHQCQNCGKYYSSNYSLNRHIETQHTDYTNLQCKVCEEIFVWPSLLKSHKCIRLKRPEMPFEDARPEIHFDNLNRTGQTGFDDFPIAVDNDEYMHSVDFEIPAPIVELTEYENFTPSTEDRFASLSNLGYKVQVMQEVPIEF